MRRARRTYQTCSSPKRIGVLLVGLCSLYLGLGSELGVAADQTGAYVDELGTALSTPPPALSAQPQDGEKSQNPS